MSTPSLRRRGAGCAALAALVLLGLSACSGSEDDAGSSDSGVAATAPRAAAGGEAEQESAESGGDFAFDRDAARSDLSSAVAAEATAEQPTRQGDETGEADDRALIRTGSVQLRSADVGQATFDVRTLASEQGGEVSEDRTETDEEGDAKRAMLVLRVPVAVFDDTMERLRALGGTELVDTRSTTADVTTEVIDVDVRVDLQRRSIERISLLLERANSIRDVVSIERELARREAALTSLERRQAYLADQTALSTITVSVTRPPEEQDLSAYAAGFTTQVTFDSSGFGSGLRDGWSAFTGATVALMTTLGAVLPFALVIAVVAVPVWLVRRRRPAPAPAPAPEPAA